MNALSVWRRLGVGLGLLLCCLAPAVAGQPLVVRYPAPEGGDGDRRHQYFVALLELALSKTDSAYALRSAPLVMRQGRALRQLRTGTDIDVVWTMTTAAREQGLRPVRVPLTKGLIGTRLLLVRAADAARFAGITEANALCALRAGQGHDWPDTRVLEANGYRVAGRASYEALFRMLIQGRIDYFPRSIEEIWSEAERYAGAGLVVEPTLVLRYPAAIYFFVAEANAALAQRIETGLRRALADGSFDALFEQHFGALLARAALESRTRFNLKNPLLPPQTPLGQAGLWYQF